MLKSIISRTWIKVKSKNQQAITRNHFSGVQQYRHHTNSTKKECNTSEPRIIKPRFRPGDWICPSCQFHNYSFRSSCGECSKPISVNQLRLGDWICPHCEYYNFQHVLSCKNCTELKPSPTTLRDQYQIKE
ncbi:hypothetical protein BJ944DRAFT_266964 [Cunninghamella echinulata]|nr:hypothetical protein BJ944DRAFT_266964 [Cunninghamella echinulata]